jgi:hypothetical protein
MYRIGLLARGDSGPSQERSFDLRIDEPLGVTPPAATLPAGMVGAAYSHNLLSTFTITGGFPPHRWILGEGSDLPPGLTLSPAGILSGTPQAGGSYSFVLHVQDSADPLQESSPISVSLTITATPTTPPLVVNTPTVLPPGRVFVPYSYQLQASGGVPPLVWSHTAGSLPNGISLRSDGLLSGTPTIAGTYTFTARVTDSEPPPILFAQRTRSRSATSSRSSAVDRTFTLTINPSDLAISSMALPEAEAGRPFTFAFTATGGSQPYTWSAQGPLPAGLTLSPAGVLSGSTAAGTYNLTVRVTDTRQATDTRSFTLSVGEDERQNTLEVSTTSLPKGKVGSIYSTVIIARGGARPYSFNISGLPPGVTAEADGELFGTPTRAGTYSVQISITDGDRDQASASLPLVIEAVPLRITTMSVPIGRAETAYTASFYAAGGSPPYQFATSDGSLAPGLTLNPSGSLSGTPTAAGTYEFSVQVTDSEGQTASQTFSGIVRERLQILTETIPGMALDSPVSLILSASGGITPYEWRTQSGTLPNGIALSSDGRLSGTPDTPGTYTFTIEATDPEQQIAARAYSVVVALPLRIVTESLPAALGGSSYSATLEATGGIQPYRWSLESGTLPAGLTLGESGALTGTPTAAGPFQFTIRVADDTRPTGTAATRAFTLQVRAPDVPQVELSGIPATPAPAQQPQLTLNLSAPYPLDLTGTLILSFEPDAANAADDPAIQFSTGGRRAAFQVPAGALTGQFAAPGFSIQTGTVAGTIIVTAELQTGGTNVNCACPLRWTIQIPRTAPVISSLRATRSGAGFNVVITGFSTTREMTQGTFRFGGSNLQNAEATVQLTNAFNTWFQSGGAADFGGQFTLTMPFTIQGDANSVTSVTVVLTNTVGSSQSMSANF